jgi:hypothetical protein
LGGEATIPHLARLNKRSIPADWKKATVVPISISFTSVVCKQMEHVIAGYLRQIWEKSEWLYDHKHGFRPGYSCESQLVTVCQDIADALDEGDRTATSPSLC